MASVDPQPLDRGRLQRSVGKLTEVNIEEIRDGQWTACEWPRIELAIGEEKRGDVGAGRGR